MSPIDGVPAFLEDDLAILLHATELPDRLREGSHSIIFDALGQVRSAPAADLVGRHALAARDALAQGDRAAAVSEAGETCGVLADLAASLYMLLRTGDSTGVRWPSTNHAANGHFARESKSS